MFVYFTMIILPSNNCIEQNIKKDSLLFAVITVGSLITSTITQR